MLQHGKKKKSIYLGRLKVKLRSRVTRLRSTWKLKLSQRPILTGKIWVHPTEWQEDSGKKPGKAVEKFSAGNINPYTQGLDQRTLPPFHAERKDTHSQPCVTTQDTQENLSSEHYRKLSPPKELFHLVKSSIGDTGLCLVGANQDL